MPFTGLRKKSFLRQKNGTSAAEAGCILSTYGTAEAVPFQSRRRKRLFSNLFSPCRSPTICWKSERECTPRLGGRDHLSIRNSSGDIRRWRAIENAQKGRAPV